MQIFIKGVTTNGNTTYTMETEGFTLFTLFHHLQDRFGVCINLGQLTCNSYVSNCNKYKSFSMKSDTAVLRTPLNQLVTNYSTVTWYYPFGSTRKLFNNEDQMITNVISNLIHHKNGLFTAKIKTEVKLTNFIFELHLVDYYNPDNYLLMKDVPYVLYIDDADKNSLKINIKFDYNSENKYMLTVKYDNSDNELKNVECDGCKTCCKLKYQELPQKVIILDQIHFKVNPEEITIYI